jgi:Histidine kinase-, DNA gyrase B-, and HSP90-like ATPase
VTERLVPKPHMLKSIRSRNWNLAGAIEELVDNSLGHGKAESVLVYIDNARGIAVVDDGVGVDDVNRIFRLGDASSHDVLSEIGQYGVGAKHATIYLGDDVSVHTARDGVFHHKHVNWRKVERSGQWPLAYRGKGRPATSDERGTKILVTELAHGHYQLVTSEKLAHELGQVFAPALRRGVEISVHHSLKSGEYQRLAVEPFEPSDMTDEIMISGQIETARGPLQWTGRAGLSKSLTERHNGVHIAFGHRVIETTREPFLGESAPTLYCEVVLDDTTPWKHDLSEHKDKVVRHRKELVETIHAAIEPLLKLSAEQSSYLALKGMTAPIEALLTRALRGAGVLHVDEEPDIDVIDPGPPGPPGPDPAPIEESQSPAEDGESAKEAKRPTGVQIGWRGAEQLEGKLWSWDINRRQILILLDREQFAPTVGYPPKVRDHAVVQLVAAFLSHGLEAEYRKDSSALIGAVTPGLRKKMQAWDEEHNSIAPYINRELITSATK